jgi:hypothetical protein
MPQVKHPYVGSSNLVWDRIGATWEAKLERVAKYRRGNPYAVREIFAYIRPAYNDAGMLDETGGWVVTRNSFDEIRSFNDLAEAKIYVESLFALETT